MESLLEQAKNLKNVSLESFVTDCTSEGLNHDFAELLTHPQVGLHRNRSIPSVQLIERPSSYL